MNGDRAPTMANETSVPTPKPHTIEGWIRLLDHVRLPVPQDSHDKVCRAIADSRSSLRSIAELMQDSPALALSLIREANHHSNSIGEPAENLEVAITRLGLKRTEELLARLPAMPLEEIPQPLRQLQLISQHASQQANGLFASRLARLWQDIHWGSLLFLSPLWPLAVTHPDLLEEWELRVIHKQEPAPRVERELFGVSLLELCAALSEVWRLPEWVTQGYRLLIDEKRVLVRVLHIARDHDDPLRQQQHLDNDQALRRWLNQPSNCVLLANGLALAAHASWDSPHTRRWEYLTSLYLQQPLAELQQHIHQYAVQSARDHGMPDLWHPAEALLWPWDSPRIHPGLFPAPPPSAQALAVWRRYCAELLGEPSRFTNTMHLTTCARDALVACGMRRVMVLMADREHSYLRAQQTAGLEKEAANLRLATRQSSVLQRLLKQPAQIRLDPDNNAQFSAHLPANLRRLFNGDHLLLRSISCNDRVIMLIMADQGGRPLSPVTVQAFGKTAQCIEKALLSFTTRGH